MAGAAGDLGGDDGRTRTRKRLVDRLARRGVVFDRPLHALHRFLRAVFEACSLASRNLPQRRLLAVAGPIGGPISDRIPTRFMLPVVMPAAQRKAVFAPNNLRADIEADRRERFLDRAGVPTGMPDVGDR